MILDRLSSRERKILYVVIALLFVLFGYHGVFQPVLSKLGGLDEEIFVFQMKLRKGRIFLRQRDEILEEAQKYPNLERIEAGSDEEELARLLNYIEQTARNAQVSLSDVKPQQVKSDKVSKSYVVELGAESLLNQLIEFIYQLQNSPQLLMIERIEMSPKEDNSPLLRSFVVIKRVVVQ